MIELKLNDIQNVHKIIETSINRGTFNATELSSIIRVYESLTNLIISEQNKPAEPVVSDEAAEAIIKT